MSITFPSRKENSDNKNHPPGFQSKTKGTLFRFPWIYNWAHYPVVCIHVFLFIYLIHVSFSLQTGDNLPESKLIHDLCSNAWSNPIVHDPLEE